jgi:hypothetical protein
MFFSWQLVVCSRQYADNTKLPTANCNLSYSYIIAWIDDILHAARPSQTRSAIT